MLRDGLFERFACDSVFGMHNRPGLPIGKFAMLLRVIRGSLDTPRDLLLFLLLSPVFCLTSATLSLSGMLALGAVAF
jgi:hypothetical protein